MLYEKIKFDETDDEAFIEVYAADPILDFTRRAILVIPGGGYSTVCSDREGEPIALAFMSQGYNAFVLHYSVMKKPFPSHLIQASLAMKYIRDNAKKYGIDRDKVFSVGFSAGGHLCASLATMWKLPEIYEAIDMPYGYNKPNGAMLIYPVISADLHRLSFSNLAMKEELSKEEKARYSIEKNVDADTAPIFIFHTSNDQVVDVRNSLVLAEALSAVGQKFELHVYPDAPHGVALGNEITRCGNDKWCDPAFERWVGDACYWANKFGK